MIKHTDNARIYIGRSHFKLLFMRKKEILVDFAKVRLKPLTDL